MYTYTPYMTTRKCTWSFFIALPVKYRLSGSSDSSTLNGSLFLWAQGRHNHFSLKIPLYEMTNNLDFDAPPKKKLKLHISSLLSFGCVWLEVVLVFCARRRRKKKSGKHGWLENAKWLPLTSAPRNCYRWSLLLSVSLSQPLSHTHLYWTSCLLSDRLIDMQPVLYHSFQHAKPKGNGKKTKNKNVESSTLRHCTLIPSHLPASHDMSLSISQVVFHVQGQRWESYGKFLTQREHMSSTGTCCTPAFLRH